MRTALVLAPPSDDRRIVTGLTLGERARRVVAQAGFPPDRVVVIRTDAELTAAAPRLTGALLVVDAQAQVVAGPLLEALDLASPGARAAIDPARGDADAGALVVDDDDAAAVVAALAADRAAGLAAARGAGAATPVPVGRRARFPVPDRAAVRAADAWQYELVDKPLDSWLCRYFYRPLARPLTKLFLRSPLTPNIISVLSIILSLAGCAIAAGPSRLEHIVGLAILVVGGVVDANDGEVARLRLEMSKAGAWLDAMGDDLARLALVIGIGVHVSHLHPSWPALTITAAAVAMTVASLVLIYWYCIFVIHSSNNQDYTKALQIGPGVRGDGPRSLGAIISDAAAQIIRRDFIDLGVLVLALFHLPEIGFVALSVGAVVTLAVVIPTHLKIVRSLRAARA
ncbi:MAG: CDP-alcohol phosphatidyltransferase family protein [Kofleriaceae bacterium]